MKDKILVSACLMGFQVRYNGSHKAQLANALSRWQSEGGWSSTARSWLPDCPSPDYRRKSLARRGGCHARPRENC
jgi:hypothetical protein